MISSDLKNLSDWTLGFSAKGEWMPPSAIAHLSKVLIDLGRQVERMELLPVNTHGPLPGEVGRSQRSYKERDDNAE